MPRILREAGRLVLAVSLTLSTAHAADFRIGNQVLVSPSDNNASSEILDFDAVAPAIAVDPERRRALVVWSGSDASMPVADPDEDDDEIPRLVKGEFEIFGNLVNSDLLISMTQRFRISTMGDDLETSATERARFDGENPAVAWNPASDEYLVVWQGDDDSGDLVDDEFEIFGQRISRDGALVGDRFRISVMGDDSETVAATRAQHGALQPAVSVDPTSGNYLVVWEGDDNVDEEFEIHGRIVTSAGKVSGEQFRISSMGDDGNAAFDALSPAVAFHPEGYFVVAWQGDDTPLDDAFEIHSQQVNTSGALVGTATRVSSMGPDDDPAFDALAPAIAIAPASGTVFIVWHGDTNEDGRVNDEWEVHGRLFDSVGAPLDDERQLSSTGPSDETDPEERTRFSARYPTVSWNEREEYFFVGWQSDLETGDFVDGELEIRGGFYAADGTTIKRNFLVSEMGTHQEDTEAEERRKYDAHDPQSAYVAGYFVTTWYGDSNGAFSRDGRDQVFARRVAQNAVELSLTSPTPPAPPKAPEPVVYEFTLENTGEITAENARVDVSNSEDFPVTLENCPEVDDTTCLFGDMEPGSSHTFRIIVSTDHLELGDVQSTKFALNTYTDNALANASEVALTFTTRVALTVEGGNGSTDGFWLLLLATAPLLRRRRPH